MATNPSVLTQFAMPDPNAAPLNLIQLFQLANVLVSSQIQGEPFLNVVVSGVQPDPDVVGNTLWVQLDSQERPIASKVYWHGKWRRVYNGMLGEIRGFSGDPSAYFNSSGLGNPEGEYDGWHLCNGLDGTPDLSDKFLIGAHMNNVDHSGYSTPDGGWLTWISNDTGMNTGGVRDFTLDEATTWQPATSAIEVRHWSATGNAPLPHTGNLWGVPANPIGDPDNDVLVPANEGHLEPDSVSVIPPFIALGWIIFIGYST